MTQDNDIEKKKLELAFAFGDIAASLYRQLRDRKCFRLSPEDPPQRVMIKKRSAENHKQKNVHNQDNCVCIYVESY